jgi:hypothetical protein
MGRGLHPRYEDLTQGEVMVAEHFALSRHRPKKGAESPVSAGGLGVAPESWPWGTANHNIRVKSPSLEVNNVCHIKKK